MLRRGSSILIIVLTAVMFPLLSLSAILADESPVCQEAQVPDATIVSVPDTTDLSDSGSESREIRMPENQADSVAAGGVAADTLKYSSTLWIKQLIANGFRIHDPAVKYPKFPRFLLKVYNWGDQTFNSYDTDYVIGTGKNWKLQGKSYNWFETASMFFPRNSILNMHSDLFADAGGHISFMAVSVGYMWNMNDLLSKATSRHTFNFDFTCSRFSVNIQSTSSDGGMRLTKLGDYNEGKHFNYKFNDVDMSTFYVDAYYFFNNKKYSHAAAYSYSKYQLKSAGTAIVGFNFSEQNIKMDFSSLPEEMLEHLPLDTPLYTFHHKDYAILGGYGYNWVLKPKRWLVNVTAMGAIGYKRTYEDSTDGKRNLVANNYKLSAGVVYNHRALFVGAVAKFNGFLYYNSSFTHFNTLNNFSVIVGMRF